MAQQHGLDSSEAFQARILERNLFMNADHVIVTTSSMRKTVIRNYGLHEDKITIIPNYVDTTLFKPNVKSCNKPSHLCFIGRLEDQKNPLTLLEALKGLDVELTMIGDGKLRDDW